MRYWGKKIRLNPLTMLALLIVVGIGLFFQQPAEMPDVQSAETDAAPIIDPYEIADYLYDYGELPENFITKAEAKALGWDSSRNDVSDVAPGMSIGGDHFGNYEGGLPDADGRDWYECDVNYVSGDRGAERVLYSSDGLVYYSPDHYETFEYIPPTED